MMGYGYGHHVGLLGFGWILMIIIWAAIIIGVIFLVRWLVEHEDHRKNKTESSPLDILRERYAKGEINKEEFEQKKKDLS